MILNMGTHLLPDVAGPQLLMQVSLASPMQSGYTVVKFLGFNFPAAGPHESLVLWCCSQRQPLLQCRPASKILQQSMLEASALAADLLMHSSVY